MARSSMTIRRLPLFPHGCIYGLLSLVVQVRFTRKRCPTDHANTLRTHQTMTAQALLGQTYPSPSADVGQAWMSVVRCSITTSPAALSPTKRRERAYPHASHSGRSYWPEWEEELLSLEKVYSYLAPGRWFRRIRPNGYFGARRAINTTLASTLRS